MPGFFTIKGDAIRTVKRFHALAMCNEEEAGRYTLDPDDHRLYVLLGSRKEILMKKPSFSLIVGGIILLSFAITLSTCGGGGGGGGTPPGPGPLPSGSEIGPAGGTVASSDNKVTLTIPAGALSQPTIITITSLSSSVPGNIGPAYSFGPDKTTFALPVTVTMTYDPFSLPAGLSGTNLRLATLFNGRHWYELLGSSVQPSTNTVTGYTYSFSTYGLIIGPFTATLAGAQEVPTNTSLASGSAMFSIDTAHNIVTYNIIYQNLAGTEQSASICGPALRGATASSKHILPAGTHKVGIWIYDETDEADILAGRMYVNILSSAYAAGELRGQIEPQGTAQNTSSVTVRIRLWDDLVASVPTNTIPAAVSRMTLDVSGFGMASLVRSLNTTTSPIEQTLTVSRGLVRRFVVRAYDSADQAVYNGTAYADIFDSTQTISIKMIAAGDTTAPGFSGLSAATKISDDSIELSWADATDDRSDHTEINYLIFAAAASGAEDLGNPAFVSGPGRTSIVISGLAPGETYYFVARAVDRAGNIDSNTAEVVVSTYAAGTGLHVDVNSGSDVAACGSATAPCKTITMALQKTAGNEPIHVAKGLYSEATGESFPLTMKSGNSLIGESFLVMVSSPLHISAHAMALMPVMPVTFKPAVLIESSTAADVLTASTGAHISGVNIHLKSTAANCGAIKVTSAVTVRYCAVYGVGNYGIWGGSGSNIQNNVVSGFGVAIQSSSGAVIEGNIVENSNYGIYVSGRNNRVHHNIVLDISYDTNGQNGIYSEGGDEIYGNIVSNCTVDVGPGTRVSINTFIDGWLTTHSIISSALTDTTPAVIVANVFQRVGIAVNRNDSVLSGNDFCGAMRPGRFPPGALMINGDNVQVDARRNRWVNDPPTVGSTTNWGGNYACPDVDICIDSIYSSPLMPLYLPTSGRSAPDCGMVAF
jgi:parallel beta-helix repeat protein